MRNQPSLQRLIPITALRHLYRLLRDFPKEEFHLAVARELSRRPDQLGKLVAESQEHFALYDNREEGFHERGVEGLPSQRMLGSAKSANMLVQQLVASDGKIATVEAAPQFDFQYVDYEINPRRTCNSEFENGRTSSIRHGGMDLLLCNRQDRIPIVGEIKADTDVNPFFGLIQSLMYSVELSTPSQRARLQKAYPGQFAEMTAGPGIDIYLILLSYPQEKNCQEFVKLTSEMAASLLKADCSVSTIVRRIVALENPVSPTSLNDFRVVFAHGYPPKT